MEGGSVLKEGRIITSVGEIRRKQTIRSFQGSLRVIKDFNMEC